MRRAPPIRLSRDERRRLGELARDRATPRRIALRYRIVLRAADGHDNRTVARELGTNPGTVALWRRRFLAQRIAGVQKDAPRPGRPPAIPTSTIQTIVRATRARPPPGTPYWSARRLAHVVGVSKSTVQRVWRSHHLHPRRLAEPARPPPSGTSFVEKVTDFVGLYLNPPERAMVFSVDEKAHGKPLLASERREDRRTEESRRATEFRAFLQRIDRETSKDLDLHLLVDNLFAPATPEVGRWLVRHPRFHLHYLPAEGSGPNLIEQLLGEFTRRKLRSAAFPSVARLHRAVQAHFQAPGAATRPLVWVASAEEIRDRLGRTRVPP